MAVSTRPTRKSIYTRRGDTGETSLFAGPRVFKDQIRIKTVGDIDELSSAIGLARAEGVGGNHDALLRRIQIELMQLGAELVSIDPIRFGTRGIGSEHITALENEIDRIEFALMPLQRFVLPGGCKSAAALHMARCICRRAERGLVTLIRKEPQVSRSMLEYLNRLSDLLFVLARFENKLHGTEEYV